MNLARALGVTPEARGVASEQFEEIREKADAAVQASDDDLDRRVDDVIGSMPQRRLPRRTPCCP